MDPIESWMDADSVRRLAHQLVTPLTSAEVDAPDDAGYDDSFVGYVQPPSSAQVAPQGPSAEDAPPKPFLTTSGSTPSAEVSPGNDPEPPAQPAVETPTPAASAAEAAVPAAPAGSSAGPLVSRMEQFRQWLADSYRSRGAFVLDRDGNPVIDDPAYAKLHFLARSLAQAYRPVKGEAGNVHVKIGSDAFLSVVPVDTAFGCLVLGAVLPTPLDAPAVRVVADALSQVATPPKR